MLHQKEEQQTIQEEEQQTIQEEEQQSIQEEEQQIIQEEEEEEENSYKELWNQYKSIEKNPYDNPSKSLKELCNICTQYCSFDDDDKERYKYCQLFVESTELIRKIIKHYQPINTNIIQECYDSFIAEDKVIRNKEEADNYYKLIFNNYQIFLDKLKPEINEVIDILPKYYSTPIQAKYLYISVSIIFIIYLGIKIYLLN